MRSKGRLDMGARYGDKGLLILKAVSALEARALMDAAPSMPSRTFSYGLHKMRVFQPGGVGPERASAPS